TRRHSDDHPGSTRWSDSHLPPYALCRRQPPPTSTCCRWPSTQLQLVPPQHAATLPLPTGQCRVPTSPTRRRRGPASPTRTRTTRRPPRRLVVALLRLSRIGCPDSSDLGDGFSANLRAFRQLRVRDARKCAAELVQCNDRANRRRWIPQDVVRPRAKRHIFNRARLPQK